MDTTRNLDVVDRKIASHYWQQTWWFNVVYSTDSFDSSNGHEPKRGFCWAENRISLLTTDPAVQRCWFDRFVQFVEWTRPKRDCCWSETRISLVTTYPAVDLWWKHCERVHINTWIFLVLKTPVKEVINTWIFLVLKTLHVDLHRCLCHENNEMHFSDRQLHVSDRQ